MEINDLVALGPFIAAVVVALAVLVVDIAVPGRRGPVLAVSLGGLAIVAALVLTTGQAVAGGDGTARVLAFGDAYVVDGLTTFLDLVFVGIVAFTIVFAPDYLEARGLPLAEFVMVLLFAMTGAMLISASADLLVLFVALELMVLPGYMLAGYHKTDGYSTEGAIKYFLLGSFSSAIFLFGLAFTWGATGTTSIDGVRDALTAAVAAGGAGISPALVLGLGFLTTGVAFKIAAVPFHYWTPDAYQGSPTPVTGYLSVGPKVAAFALILRLFVEALGPLRLDWLQVVIILAIVTMTLGNLVGLTQTNVKRMLGYSSIAHTGYMLVGLAAFAAGRIEGLEGLLYYFAAYSVMNLGAFAVVAAIQRRAGVTSGLDTFAGLGRREPWLAILLTLFLLSLTGIPPTAGFFAKAYVILAAVQAGDAGYTSLTVLAVITMLNAAIAAFYYLRVVVYMFMREPRSQDAPMAHGRLMWGGLAVASILTVLLGLIPGPFLDIVGQAARAIGG
ncbi:MAG: NADH-quinone oxidoreductase subunit N [Chloroflexota bacterium]